MTPILSRKRLVILLLAGLATPLSLTAGASPSDGHDRGPQTAPHLQALYDRAGLDAETREALNEARAEHQEALKALREEHRQRMDELLDDDQREALEKARREMREAQRAERREAMQERLAALVDSWELSEEKRQALRETRETLYTDMQTLREREFDSREARHEAWQALREEHHAALAEILTEEQIAEMREAVSPRHYRDQKGHGREGRPSE
ncbi:hypothetical protein [Halomonas cerina]|uniref:HD-GYP domain-containing protein (C-di-GMP phosphodiesterase class II) n=1 Tax=Halomonas cerina TaxID=447424 RepID=A0A839VAE2_9GAMM|nr:hypothetical protein [Halomonas cerina]MBB3189496.1 HD-GYP domain-containing protein (c-di-GMP phosphodiesterase class II) [Halomonas cerina]